VFLWLVWTVIVYFCCCLASSLKSIDLLREVLRFDIRLCWLPWQLLQQMYFVHFSEIYVPRKKSSSGTCVDCGFLLMIQEMSPSPSQARGFPSDRREFTDNHLFQGLELKSLWGSNEVFQSNSTVAIWARDHSTMKVTVYFWNIPITHQGPFFSGNEL